ncbi:dihydropteroate synthase [Roseococcus suduntuyensis]|uniref:dihydropteroate synthase n=1 Tax=Roseococcus suduntuyensis TaxID=455361 RepID=A0A840ABK0_9PROT|nr:dihydropteroate synthase [Roseococcus suduntuyensis]MBB3898272.1 dihydropteroate synthase [Roseococcus suduntuyensis]
MTLIEPHGLLDGPAAEAAIREGLALPLQGGPFAFMGLRDDTGAPLPLAAASAALTAPPAPFAGIARHRFRPLVMGIVNCTPDSFSGDGRAAHATAIAHGHALRAEGADILDVGGESTRPGAAPVTPEEEQARILPVIAALASGGPVSVDTRHAATMRAALAAGASIVNDVSALAHDPESLATVAAAGCPVVLMHMRTLDPRTMQQGVAYTDAAREVAAHLAARIAACEEAGISRARIAVDPGIGFGKRVRDNLDLVARLPLLAALGCTILVGASRKGFIGRITGVAEPSRRVAGSVALALEAARRGAHILRVHDVGATVEALKIQEAVTMGWTE